MATLTSRQRMLRALSWQEVDQIPCCFMSFTALRRRHNENLIELAKAERAMGLDAMLFIPSAPRPERPDHPDLRGLPIRFHPTVKVRQWQEDRTDVLHKEYVTPAGTLTTGVRLSADWPYGTHIPFVGDYQIPRATKPLITSPEELEALDHLLTAPQEQDIARYMAEAKAAHAFVDEHSVLLAGGWGVGMDMLNWLCGMQELMVLTIQQPAFVDDLIGMVARWNKQRMMVVLDGSLDLYIRRAWYEGCDFVTPGFFRASVLPWLKAEVELAHERGAKFGYICTLGTKPMLDMLREAGIDVLIGVDPIQDPRAEMALVKEKLGRSTCLWGGVSGAVTVERGSEQEVRSAVRQAVDTLGPSGFILSPVDNITVDDPHTWRNVDVLIDEWRKCR